MEVAAAVVEANKTAQFEEIEALRYIYGEEECSAHQDEHYCEFQVYPAERDAALKLIIFFPETYPSTSEPIVEIQAPWLCEELQDNILSCFHSLYLESCGEVVVFKWIEWIKDQEWLWQAAREWKINENEKKNLQDETSIASQSSLSDRLQESHKSKSKQENEIFEDSQVDEIERILGIYHGEPFTERRSTFQAHLAAVNEGDKVEIVMETLLKNRKIASATHNIIAYRINIPSKHNTVLQDYDDDGESGAGSRLLHLLQIVDAVNVVVVVSRWFGGILLGGDRFKHINNAARSILESCGYIKQSSGNNNKKKMMMMMMMSNSSSISKKGKGR